MIVLRSTRARPLCQRWLSTAATAKSYPAEERFPASSTNLRGVPSREHQIERLSGGVEEFDLVVVGGGATGCGAALDAQLRGLNVALVERGDFSSETSSRSTKLVWAGIRYIGTATASLLRVRNLTRPREALKDFWGEMQMVIGAHRERRFMLEQQAHLTNWVPIAVPMDKWFIWPPPMGHSLFSLMPMVLPLVMKFYDSLCGFTCPSSHIMDRRRARRKVSERVSGWVGGWVSGWMDGCCLYQSWPLDGLGRVTSAVPYHSRNCSVNEFK